MHVADIFSYPVKSLAGDRLRRTQFAAGGFWADRRWVVVDDKNVRPSSRKDTLLATLQASWNEDNSIRLAAKVCLRLECLILGEVEGTTS